MITFPSGESVRRFVVRACGRDDPGGSDRLVMGPCCPTCPGVRKPRAESRCRSDPGWNILTWPGVQLALSDMR